MKEIDDGRNDPNGDITSVLVRRKWQILIVFLVVVTGVTIGTFRMPKQYESHLKILVKNERADMAVTSDNNTPDYGDTISEEQINTEDELLDSDNLLRQVVEKCGLEKLEVSYNSAAGSRPVAIERAVGRLHKDLKISPVRKSNIIEIDYESPNPRLAAEVLRQLADFYIALHLRVHSTPGSYDFFSGQASRYGKELSDAEARLAAFGRQDHVVALAQQKQVVLQKAADSEAALLQAEAAIGEDTDKIADTRGQLDSIPSRVITQNRTGPNQYTEDHLSSMLADLRNRRTELVAKFRPDDRLVQDIDKEIADTQSSLEQAAKSSGIEQSTDVNPIRQALEIDMAKEQDELAGLQARRQSLAEQAQGYQRQLVTLGNATAQFDDLTRAQKEAEDNFLLYSKKTEEARIAESLDRQKIANVVVAEPPMESHQPVKPNVPMNMGLGVVMGGFLSVGIAFSAEHRRQFAQHSLADTPADIESDSRNLLEPVEQAAELEELTGLAVLATVHRS